MRRENRPPLIAEWILGRVKYRNRKDGAHLGDFEELYYEICDEEGRASAWRWYWSQVLIIVFRQILNSIVWSATMLKNYFLISFRNIKKHKGYSAINILGLTLGLTTTTLIMMFIAYETSYDHFHKDADNLYRVQVEWKQGGIDNYTWHPLGDAMKRDIPEVIQASRVEILDNVVVKNGESSYIEKRFMHVDSDFLHMFSFPLLKGSAETALAEHNSIVLTEKCAKKYFGDVNPLNKTLKIRLWEGEEFFKVTGVLKELPGNTYFSFDSLIVLEKSKRKDLWSWTSPFTFVRLGNKSDKSETEKRFPELIKKYAKGASASIRIHLQPVKEIHLSGNKKRDFMGTNSDIRYIYILSIIGVLIIVVACFNYMNLAAARSAGRAGEIGLRKVSGAGRGQLIRQFLGESVFFSILSLVFALGLVFLLLPVFSCIMRTDLDFSSLFTPQISLLLIIMTLVTGLIAGSYPAVYLSAFKAIDAVRGCRVKGVRNSRFRNVLVVVQFVISGCLISGYITINMQLKYLQNSNPGYEKENIVNLVSMNKRLNRDYKEFRSELLKHTGIYNVSAGLDLPVTMRRSAGVQQWSGHRGDGKITVIYSCVDENYIDTYGMTLLEGRNFWRNSREDLKNSVIINETAVEKFGWKEPLGKTIVLYGKKWNVIGVVNDFNYRSLKSVINPLVLRYDPARVNYFALRLSGRNIVDTISYVEKLWEEFAPGSPFALSFFDDTINRMYESEKELNRIFTFFTIIAVFISCLGLLGLASYTAEQRTREIGIRKVLGASVSGIAMLLVKEFFRWLILANLIALPLAYFSTREWLSGFAYHMQPGFMPYIISAATVFLIAGLTVAHQVLKASKGNPVDTLKSNS